MSDARDEAVGRAIATMRQQLGEPQRLRDMARVALMSPFHFHRVFRQMTAATPGRFLTAMRMAEAKRLLLETTISATDISVAVGYLSFGTFTTQFTRLVGVPPGRFRALAQPIADVRLRSLLDIADVEPRPAQPAVHGWLGPRPDGSPGITVVGVFPAGMPQQRPLACAITTSPGAVALPVADDIRTATAVRPPTASVLAVSVARDATVGQILTGSAAAGTYVGAARLVPRAEVASRHGFAVRLREQRPTDPPLLLSYPLLIGGGSAAADLPASGA